MILTRRQALPLIGAGALIAPRAQGLILRGGSASASAGATFDFYIATAANGGSDTNLGTLSSPWAITSLTRTSSNRLHMAGKRVGLLPGIYGIYSLWNSGLYTYETPCLALPSGTDSGHRTFIGASDSSGHQTNGASPTAGTHFITASPSGTPGGGFPGTTSSSIAMLGFDYRDSGGHVQIDGLSLSDSSNLIVSYYTGVDCWVTNCHVYNVQGDEGNNTGALWFGGGANGGVQNCIVHNVQITGVGDQHNCAGIFTENSLGNLYEYNTIYDCNCGIYDKNQNDGGHTYRYNYIEVNGLYPWNCLMDCAGGPLGYTSKVYNNILVIAPSTSVERSFWQGICTNGPAANPTQAMQFYNNTCYVLSGGGVQMGVTYQSPGAGSVTHYNNIYVGAAPGFYDTINFNSTAGAIAISDYNAYIGGCGGTGTSGAYFGQGTNGAPASNYTFNSWKSIPLDTHSFIQAGASGVFQSPGGAQNPSGYQLVTGPTPSPCIGAGRAGGTSGGAVVDQGAWGGIDVNTGGPITRIGSNL